MNLDDYPIFSDNKSLKELSYDSSHDEYLTESKDMAVDFDFVKKKYCNKHGMSEECACSADAVLSVNDETIFIEFKNGNARDEKNPIKEKMNESILIYCDITGQLISNTRKNTNFVLVYNSERIKISPNDEKAMQMARMSGLPYTIIQSLD